MPRAIKAWENVYTNFKGRDTNFSKTIFTIPFLCTRHTSIQTFQYKVIQKTLACNEWLKNIGIKTDDICSYCSNIDTISHFLIDCNSNKLFWKGWARWWLSITSFNIRMEENIHESILFGFPESSDNAIVINYCILYAKQ